MSSLHPNSSQVSILMLVMVLCMNIFAIGLLLDSKHQRSQAKADRRETICILKIDPLERRSNPEKVKKCEASR